MSPAVAVPGGRRERILDAAADLLARRGYHAVAMADIGAAAGITGPGVYRHFENKLAVLVILLDRVVDELLGNVASILATDLDAAETLDQLVRDQVRFVLTKRVLIQVYLQEVQALPDDDRRRLRRKQRRYVEEWVRVLRVVRPELSNDEARMLVLAAIGAIQSTVHVNERTVQDQLESIMISTAEAVLATSISDDGRTAKGQIA